jgi:non-ribosomal peptide synthetase component F
MKKLLQHWLSSQAEHRPEACAVVSGKQRATYGQLEEASNRLARALKAAGCTRGDRVALLLPKSIQSLIALVAVLKADCIYVPLDTASPTARLLRILQVCESRCVLAVRSTAPCSTKSPKTGVSKTCLESDGWTGARR